MEPGFPGPAFHYREISMEPNAHQFIRISGTPYERGLSYGRQAKERIHRVVEEYKVLFDKEAHCSWEAAVRFAQRYEAPIAAVRPDLIEEMRGIAEGAGIPFEEELLLNSRSEVMFAKPEDSCTVVGIPPEASTDGKTYLGQNWDWWTIGEGTTVIVEVEQEPYQKALVLTEAGLVGGKGLNAAGICVTLNAMSVRQGKIGVPLQVMLRQVLSQPTVPKAIESMSKMQRAGSGCVGIGSADGLVMMVEEAPGDMDVIPCDGKPICHTNHWQSLKMLMGGEAAHYSYGSTFVRLDRARRLTAQNAGNLCPETMFRIFSDHVGHPEGICRHDDMTVPVYHRHTSLWSVVFDPSERAMWLTEGSPCKNSPKLWKLG